MAALETFTARSSLLFAINPSAFISGRNTFIAMMKATEFYDCYDRSVFHNLTLYRALLAELGRDRW